MYSYLTQIICIQLGECKSSRCVVVNPLAFELEIQSQHYVHFGTNIFRKSMNPLIPQPAMG